MLMNDDSWVHNRVIKDLSLPTFPYRFLLWSSHCQSFTPIARDIEPNRDIGTYEWNYADHVTTVFHSSFLDAHFGCVSFHRLLLVLQVMMISMKD